MTDRETLLAKVRGMKLAVDEIGREIARQRIAGASDETLRALDHAMRQIQTAMARTLSRSVPT